MKTIRFLIFAVAISVFVGCGAIQPGADPVVVNAERVQTVSTAALYAVVDFDQTDRGFWKTNAPAFHQFVETLRVPVPVSNLPAGRTTLPRYLASLWTFDQAKLAYKTTKSVASSNALVAAQLSLQALSDQTRAWLTIITNNPAH